MVCIDFEGAPKRKQTASSEMSDACTTALINMDTSVQRMSEAAVQLVCHFMSLESGSVTLSHTACVEPLSECSLMGVGGGWFCEKCALLAPCGPGPSCESGGATLGSEGVSRFNTRGSFKTTKSFAYLQFLCLYFCAFLGRFWFDFFSHTLRVF